MIQQDLERGVARATGESLDCIRQRGFSLLVPPLVRSFKKSVQITLTITLEVTNPDDDLPHRVLDHQTQEPHHC